MVGVFATPAAISAPSEKRSHVTSISPQIPYLASGVAVSGSDEGGAVERNCGGSGVAYSAVRNREP
jgi:hypothetical protein